MRLGRLRDGKALIMRLSNKAAMVLRVMNARFLKKRFPLVASWALTSRCNLKCLYCAYSQDACKELDLVRILALIDELKSIGNRCIIFTGGEALLKEGIKEIIEHSSGRGIYTVLNSNGTLVKERIEEIALLNEIQLSLDGPEPVHDFIRNKTGTYNKVIEAAKTCKDRRIKVRFITVLSKYNLTSFQHVIDLAKEFGGVYFQPATKNLFGSEKENPALVPVGGYREAISYLIREKQKGNPAICNTESGLRYLLSWPDPKRIFCLAQLLHCYIEPDGRVFTCDRLPGYQNFLVPLGEDFKSTFKKITCQHCSSCWCGAKTDFNLAGEFNIEAILSMRNRIVAT